MTTSIIQANDTDLWRAIIERFERADVCQLPEYHVAYSGRIGRSKPLLWSFEAGNDIFAYPFLLTPFVLKEEPTEYNDISSIYGYSGPLSTTTDSNFIKQAWEAFDEWSDENNIIAEFTRFSLFADNTQMAHPNTEILENRPQSITYMPANAEDLLAALNKKTRNMIRKADKEGLIAKQLDPAKDMSAFRTLYSETMDRNDAPDFFLYDDKYYDLLLSLPTDELILIGVYKDDKLVASAMALAHGEGALYHLGASLQEYNNLGAGNLALYKMSCVLLKQGVKFLTVGGGRTTAPDDPLFRFKKSNGTDIGQFYIGKRIVNNQGYQDVVKRWQALYNTEVDAAKLLFYRD